MDAIDLLASHLEDLDGKLPFPAENVTDWAAFRGLQRSRLHFRNVSAGNEGTLT